MSSHTSFAAAAGSLWVEAVYAVHEVVPRAWTLFFAEMVERPDLAADINDPSSVVPEQEAQERVWAALRKDLRSLSEVHGMDLG